MQNRIPIETEFDVYTHVTQDISFSSHWEMFFIVCCMLIAVVAFARNRTSGALPMSFGFLLVLAKYVLGHVLVVNNYNVSPTLSSIQMGIGPVGLALVTAGLFKLLFNKSGTAGS